MPPRRSSPARPASLGSRDLESLLAQIERLAALGPTRARRSSRQRRAERLRGLVRQAILEQERDQLELEDDESSDRDDAWGGDEDEEDEDLGWSPWRGRDYFAPSQPIKVEGGLATKSRRGAIGSTWWSKRFLEAVEPFMAGGRSTRGRSYARRGQVIELSVGPGKVTARVQGSRPSPYKVQLALSPVSEEQWEEIAAALATQAGHAARLLAGEIPAETEEIFSATGVSLLPSRRSARLATDCSCPDWANPCKHVGAVCYLLAEEFDRDPFQLLAWRGKEREALLERLRVLRGGAIEDGCEQVAPSVITVTSPPLSQCLLGFWKAGPELAEVRIRPQAAEVPAAVLRQLPRGLIEVSGRDLADVLEPAYADLVSDAAAPGACQLLSPEPLTEDAQR